jgi:hypothetical protein
MSERIELFNRVRKAKVRLNELRISKAKYFGTYGAMNYKSFLDLDNRWSCKVVDKEFVEKLENYIKNR